MIKYESTPNKDLIRIFDKKLIENLYESKDRKLKYIGLPSPELKDILEWNEYLERIYAIEKGTQYENHVAPHNMLLKATRLGIRNKIELIRGDLDDVLMAGKNFSGKLIDYPFDIAFFDFFGGLLNKKFKRAKAIKEFIKNQSPNEFLLFMTFNLRYSDKEEESYALNNLKKEIEKYSNISNVDEVFRWYSDEDVPPQYRQKVFVSYMQKDAELMGYKVRSESPIFYFGYNNSPMIHFITIFKHTGEHVTKAISEQNLIDIINLPLRTVEDGFIIKCKLQAPKL